MQILKLLVLLVSMLGMTGGAEWCYKSQVSCDNKCKGPDEWKDISPTCGNRSQSPINIVTKRVESIHLAPLSLQGYQHVFQSIITNNGHTVKFNLSGDAVIDGAGFKEPYKAMEVHFHWGKNGGPGSEHTIDGEQYPMEMHIVHIKKNYSSVEEAVKDPSGLAVFGFLYELAVTVYASLFPDVIRNKEVYELIQHYESDREDNKYDSIINALSDVRFPGNKTVLASVNLNMLIPPHDTLMRYFRYSGSLTTPDCAESVIWTVFESTIKLSKKQLSTFSELWFENGTAMTDTFRPVQPRNGRTIFYSRSNIASVSTVLVVSTLIITFLTL